MMANIFSGGVKRFLTRLVIHFWLKHRLWALKSKMSHELNLLARERTSDPESLFGGILLLHTIIGLIPDDLLNKIPFTEEVGISISSRFETSDELLSRLKEVTVRISLLTKEMTEHGFRRNGFNLNRKYENATDKNYGFYVKGTDGTLYTVKAIQAQLVLILSTHWYDIMAPDDVKYLDRQTVLLVKDLSSIIDVVVNLVFSLKPEHF